MRESASSSSLEQTEAVYKSVYKFGGPGSNLFASQFAHIEIRAMKRFTSQSQVLLAKVNSENSHSFKDLQAVRGGEQSGCHGYEGRGNDGAV